MLSQVCSQSTQVGVNLAKYVTDQNLNNILPSSCFFFTRLASVLLMMIIFLEKISTTWLQFKVFLSTTTSRGYFVKLHSAAGVLFLSTQDWNRSLEKWKNKKVYISRVLSVRLYVWCIFLSICFNCSLSFADKVEFLVLTFVVSFLRRVSHYYLGRGFIDLTLCKIYFVESK